MSEKRAGYKVNAGAGMAMEDLATLDCTRLYSDPSYRPPTPNEINALIKLAGWSQVEAAKIVGANFNPEKGSPTIRRWRAPEGSGQHREIPYAAWRLMLITAGVVEQPSIEGHSGMTKKSSVG